MLCFTTQCNIKTKHLRSLVKGVRQGFEPVEILAALETIFFIYDTHFLMTCLKKKVNNLLTVVLKPSPLRSSLSIIHLHHGFV